MGLSWKKVAAGFGLGTFGIGLAAGAATGRAIREQFERMTGVEELRKQRELQEKQLAQDREALAALQKEPEPAVPLPDDDASRRARRRSVAAQLARRGRQSTILTGNSGDTLGGG